MSDITNAIGGLSNNLTVQAWTQSYENYLLRQRVDQAREEAAKHHYAQLDAQERTIEAQAQAALRVQFAIRDQQKALAEQEQRAIERAKQLEAQQEEKERIKLRQTNEANAFLRRTLRTEIDWASLKDLDLTLTVNQTFQNLKEMVSALTAPDHILALADALSTGIPEFKLESPAEKALRLHNEILPHYQKIAKLRFETISEHIAKQAKELLDAKEGPDLPRLKISYAKSQLTDITWSIIQERTPYFDTKPYIDQITDWHRKLWNESLTKTERLGFTTAKKMEDTKDEDVDFELATYKLDYNDAVPYFESRFQATRDNKIPTYPTSHNFEAEVQTYTRPLTTSAIGHRCISAGIAVTAITGAVIASTHWINAVAPAVAALSLIGAATALEYSFDKKANMRRKQEAEAKATALEKKNRQEYQSKIEQRELWRAAGQEDRDKIYKLAPLFYAQRFKLKQSYDNANHGCATPRPASLTQLKEQEKFLREDVEAANIAVWTRFPDRAPKEFHCDAPLKEALPPVEDPLVIESERVFDYQVKFLSKKLSYLVLSAGILTAAILYTHPLPQIYTLWAATH